MSPHLHRSIAATALTVAAVVALLSAPGRRLDRVGAEVNGTPDPYVDTAPAPVPGDQPAPTDAPMATEVLPPTDAPEPTETPTSVDSVAPTIESDAAASPAAAVVDDQRRTSAAWISPNNASAGDPGASMFYAHVATNLGDHAEVTNLTASSSSGWTVGVFEADGTTPLLDHDGDGLSDTGSLAPGASLSISVSVLVPPDALAESVDVTTVTASAADDPSRIASASDVTTVNRVLNLTVEPTELTFGLVAADGSLDPDVPGIDSAVDDAGAYYVMDEAIHVTIESNAPWSGACYAEENAGSATTVTVADGRLEGRVAGTATWTAFAVAGEPTSSTGWCFPAPAPGTATVVFDIRLRIDATDPPGTFSAKISFVTSS